ncbi:TerC/Alx family metal homeostasis membrane protein [Labrys sp. KNU-23]|uniref:TerC/Alx family metal homeostasis membrane protein n=1 Tax=Labrys sp. KNU-23 TaxID=2789216 RepID=UPI0011EED647|nr:TerC/Alx family metal homeostasis membrane protein [Labrys sp. KNU-23]QEN91064.1 TerC/Alx family metal homeostasis membrane protein [Labrys sp. KNU-23]
MEWSVLSLASADILGAPPWFWAIFASSITAILIFDLGYLNRRIPVLSLGQSIALTTAYAVLAALFGCGAWLYFGPEKGALFFTAYALEQSLSIDNVFVMSVIFAFFGVPRQYQHRVLFWGIVVAIVLRAVFVGLGAAIVARFAWVLYLFGFFLIVTGLRMLRGGDEQVDLDRNRAVAWFTRHVRMTTRIAGEHFFVRLPEHGSGGPVLHATPLFAAFAVINVADIVFAVDSFPAVLSQTQDPFIVYTSNIFAILGLRALYFVIDALIARFRYLKIALAMLLIFIGAVIFYKRLVGEFDNVATMAITFTTLVVAIIASILKPAKT